MFEQKKNSISEKCYSKQCKIMRSYNLFLIKTEEINLLLHQNLKTKNIFVIIHKRVAENDIIRMNLGLLMKQF